MRHLNDFFSQFKIRFSESGYHRMINPFDNSRHYNMVVCYEGNFVQDWKTGYKKSIAGFVSDWMKIPYAEAAEFVGFLDVPVLNINVEKFSPSAFPGITFPEGTLPLSETDNFVVGMAHNYLRSRRRDPIQYMMKGWSVGTIGQWYGRLMIPYKVAGKLVYYQGRSFVNSEPKYLNPKTSDVLVGKSEIFYNQDALLRYSSGFLVEGVFDADSLGDNAIAAGGWQLSAKQKQLIFDSGWKELHIVPDRGFRNRGIATGMEFRKHMKVYVHDFPSEFKDIDEAGRENLIIHDKSL